MPGEGTRPALRECAALADDLGRFQRGEPILARPTPAWEKPWKWARRRPAVAVLLVTLILLTITALSSVTILWRQTAAALVAMQKERDDKEAELSSKLIALAERDWIGNDLETAKHHLDECPPNRRDAKWRYLHRVCNACIFTLRESGKEELLPVSALAWSADGRYVAANPSYRAGVTVWNARTGGELFTLKGYKFRVSWLAFDPEGHLVSLGWPAGPAAPAGKTPLTYEVKIWDPNPGKEVGGFTKDLPVGRGPLSADGRRIVNASGGKLTMVEIARGPVLTKVAEPRVSFQAIGLSTDGGMIAWSDAKGIRVWDTKKNAEAGSIVGITKVQNLEFSPDGARLAFIGPRRSRKAQPSWKSGTIGRANKSQRCADTLT